MSIEDKLTTIAENEQKVYEAGQKSMIDESKIIEATTTGENILALDDVSEIPHEVSVSVKRKNLISSPFGTFDVENGKTYTLSFKLKEGVTLPEDAQYMLCYYDKHGYWNNQNLIQDGVVVSTEYSFTAGHNENHDYHIDYINMTEDMFEYAQLEELVDLSSATVRVSGKNWLKPNFTSRTHNGITYETLKNGCIHVYGTNNTAEKSYFNMVMRLPLSKGVYAGSGCPAGGSASTYKLEFYNAVANKSANDYGNGVTFTVEEGETITVQLGVYAGQTVDFMFEPMIEPGFVKTEYEPYIEPIELTFDETGKAKTKSLCPNMTFISSVNGVQITADYHKSYGMQTEYDKFWDGFQNYGARTMYGNAFGFEWNDNIFKPKYDIVPAGDNGADNMFFQTKIVDLAACLEKANIKFDTSQATRLNGVFDRSANLESVPPLNAVNATRMVMTYYNSNKIKKIVIKNIQASCTFDRAFNYLSALETLELNNCIIGQNGFNVQWSPKLSHDSIVSIINALSTTTSGLTVTLSRTAVNNAFETSAGAGDGSTSQEWLNLIATRNNWTISLV